MEDARVPHPPSIRDRFQPSGSSLGRRRDQIAIGLGPRRSAVAELNMPVLKPMIRNVSFIDFIVGGDAPQFIYSLPQGAIIGKMIASSHQCGNGQQGYKTPCPNGPLDDLS